MTELTLNDPELFLYNARKGIEYMVEQKWNRTKILRNYSQWVKSLRDSGHRDLAQRLSDYTWEMMV